MFKFRIEAKNLHRVLESNKSQITKTRYTIKTNKKQTQKIDKDGSVAKDGSVLYKLINNATYVKTMENLRYRIDLRLASNENTI